MIMRCYSIYDEKAKTYGKPFYQHQDGQAMRTFGDLTEDKDSSINKHPGDYKLYRVGYFSDDKGEFRSEEKPIFLAHAIDFVKLGEQSSLDSVVKEIANS